MCGLGLSLIGSLLTRKTCLCSSAGLKVTDLLLFRVKWYKQCADLMICILITQLCFLLVFNSIIVDILKFRHLKRVAMRRLLFLVFVPIILNSSLVSAKRTPKRLQDKPRNEFVSLGSLDEMIQTTGKSVNRKTYILTSINSALVENTRVSHLNVSLEKLVEKQSSMRTTPQKEVQHIERIQIHAPSSQSTTIDRDVYPKAVDALRKIVPNLQTVTLIGSYMYKPGNEVCFIVLCFCRL